MAKRCYFCKQPLGADRLTMWVDEAAFHLGDPPAAAHLVITEPVHLCARCHDICTAVDRVKSDLKDRVPPPVRIYGHLVRALDRGFHRFEDPEQFSEMDIAVYEDGPSYGTWTFKYFYRNDIVQVEHVCPHEERSPDGTFLGGGSLTISQVSAEHWRSNAVDVVAQYVGPAIASAAAPMLQVPGRDEVDETLNEEWARLLDRLDEQDSGKRERCDGFLDWCWDRGALSLDEVEKYRHAWARRVSSRLG